LNHLGFLAPEFFSNYLSVHFYFFLFECTWWRLFQKLVVCTKLDIYISLLWHGLIPLLVDYKCLRVVRDSVVVCWLFCLSSLVFVLPGTL
jgi:hypothetical protein